MRDLVESLLALTRGDEGAPLDVGRHDLGEVAKEAVADRQGRRRRQGLRRVRPPGARGSWPPSIGDRILQVASILAGQRREVHAGGRERYCEGKGGATTASSWRSRTRASVSARTSCPWSSSASTGRTPHVPRTVLASASPSHARSPSPRRHHRSHEQGRHGLRVRAGATAETAPDSKLRPRTVSILTGELCS